MAITRTHLTHGLDTTNNPATTASITAAAGDLIVVDWAVAATGGTPGPWDTFTVAGTGLTFTQLGAVAYGSRRAFATLVALVPPGGFSGTLSLTWSPFSGASGTFAENGWRVTRYSGVDATDVLADAAASYNNAGNTGGTNVAAGSIGGAAAGDWVHFGGAIESNGVSPTIYAESTALGSNDGATDVRTMVSGYIDTPDAGAVAGFQWTGNNGNAIGAFLVRAASGGGGSSAAAARHHSIQQGSQ